MDRGGVLLRKINKSHRGCRRTHFDFSFSEQTSLNKVSATISLVNSAASLKILFVESPNAFDIAAHEQQFTTKDYCMKQGGPRGGKCSCFQEMPFKYLNGAIWSAIKYIKTQLVWLFFSSSVSLSKLTGSPDVGKKKNEKLSNFLRAPSPTPLNHSSALSLAFRLLSSIFPCRWGDFVVVFSLRYLETKGLMNTEAKFDTKHSLPQHFFSFSSSRVARNKFFPPELRPLVNSLRQIYWRITDDGYVGILHEKEFLKWV